MTVKEHYENHLGDFYSWMMGDFDSRKNEFLAFCKRNELRPSTSKIAIDLDAGHGIQSIALAEIGFKVLAIDFNAQLLSELETRKNELPIQIINSDFKSFVKYGNQAALIVCCGDTISHLDSVEEITQLFSDIHDSLAVNGKFVLSFRDYSYELTDSSRFIPVKNDASRILTCFLEYYPDKVRVTDIFHQLIDGNWEQRISSYDKVRISEQMILSLLKDQGFEIAINETINRLVSVIAIKK